MRRLSVIALLSLATLSAPAFSQTTDSARPGTLNYIEGSASVGDQPVNRDSIGHTELQAGEVLHTSANSRAELLLTPGVFLRLDGDSAVQMVSPNLTNTEVRLQSGRIQVEVDELYKENNIRVAVNGDATQLLKPGLYGFDATPGAASVRVFDGKAAVLSDARGDAGAKPITVKGGREYAFDNPSAAPQKFDKKAAEAGQLYSWSNLRSQYLGEANADLAVQYAGAGNFNPGWYWDTGLYGYTWLPGDGAFLNPFGWGFYSPYYVSYGGPFIGRGYGYGYGRGYGYGGGYGGIRRGPIGRPAPANAGTFRGGGIQRPAPGTFHGGTNMSGGFHGGSMGGGGGFHGGGMSGGGGMHGGGGGGHR